MKKTGKTKSKTFSVKESGVTDSEDFFIIEGLMGDTAESKIPSDTDGCQLRRIRNRKNGTLAELGKFIADKINDTNTSDMRQKTINQLNDLILNISDDAAK